jgi:hypothetical protein
VLGALCGVALAPQLIPLQTQAARTSTESWETIVRSIREQLRVPQQTQELAQRFRATSVHRAGPNTLLAALRTAPAPLTTQSVVELIRERRAKDFRANQVVVLDGWLFSRTEAELCELLSMRDPIA